MGARESGREELVPLCFICESRGAKVPFKNAKASFPKVNMIP